MADWKMYLILNAILISGIVIMNWRVRRQFKNCPCKRGGK